MVEILLWLDSLSHFEIFKISLLELFFFMIVFWLKMVPSFLNSLEKNKYRR